MQLELIHRYNCKKNKTIADITTRRISHCNFGSVFVEKSLQMNGKFRSALDGCFLRRSSHENYLKIAQISHSSTSSLKNIEKISQSRISKISGINVVSISKGSSQNKKYVAVTQDG